MSRLEYCHFHGLPAVRLHAANGATATVTLHGAHVVSWTSAAGVEQLYLSPLTQFQAGQAIRGGVPLVFPQFNTRGPLPRHGFARTTAWELAQDAPTPQGCSATLTLGASPATQAIWPHAFVCSLQVALHDDTLRMVLTVGNRGSSTFSFQAALHTYLAVGSIASMRLQGLDGCDFEDTTEAQPMVMKRHSALQPFEAIDRIYYNAPANLVLHSERGQMDLQQTGFTDTVVWNPGSKATPPADLPAKGFEEFLCVEAACIGQPVTLQPAQLWSGAQTLHAAR